MAQIDTSSTDGYSTDEKQKQKQAKKAKAVAKRKAKKRNPRPHRGWSERLHLTDINVVDRSTLKRAIAGTVVGNFMQPRMFISVVLPEPDDPTTASH